ncbi:MAG: GNAT family N-acetyltransferase [Deltaproteobacteria bacterium]|nr:GNAT family N-acetyltransferase [Deltaproteobacteria bacterium]
MDSRKNHVTVAEIRRNYPEKFAPEGDIFSRIHRGARVFIGTGCGEPQFLVRAFMDFARSHPKAVYDAEIFQVWSLGMTPFPDEKLHPCMRHNFLFFGSNPARYAVNKGIADYTPIFLSQIPQALSRRLLPLEVAMVQTSPPDASGTMSLGISVDVTKAAVKNSLLVIAQVNENMPSVHGDSRIHIDEVDYIVPYDEPLMEIDAAPPDETTQRIGTYVSRLINDGSTIHVGWGKLLRPVLANLRQKKHLGVHTDLLTDGIVDLMRGGVIDNRRKSIDRGKTVVALCMGKKDTYDYIHENPRIEFRTMDYTNNPLVISRQVNMVSVISALEVDLTGQATAESIGRLFYSGLGGQADFMRGAALAPGGESILAVQSTASYETVSRIVPLLQEGAGVTLNRGDVHYVVTEYGIAYLYGKSVRERAMDLISIAHPKFRPWLVEEAKRLSLIYEDQYVIPGEGGKYPEHLESYRRTKSGLEVLLRPVKISDEPLLKEFFYSLSGESRYRRFFVPQNILPHELLQQFVVLDYTKQMAIFAVVDREGREELVGVGRYAVAENKHTADAAFVVKDAYQNQGIGRELVFYIAHLARRQGLLGISAEVLDENKTMLHLFDLLNDRGCEVKKNTAGGVIYLDILFK